MLPGTVHAQYSDIEFHGVLSEALLENGHV